MSNNFEARPAEVPTELVPLIDDHFLETQERWQNASYSDVVPVQPELKPIDIGDEVVRVAALSAPKDWDGSVTALAYPFQQSLNETMTMRAAFMQQAVMPHSRVLLLPNVHTGKEPTFTFSDADKARLSEGSLAPLAEKYVRLFEKLRVGDISLTGYSQGARTALNIAAVGSDKFHITAVNADEVPSAPGRDAKQLQKDFMKSGTFGMQRKSMGESGFGSLMKEYAGLGLAVDYAKFGVASLGSVSKLVHQAMTGDVQADLKQALRNTDDMTVKLGVVEGSRLSQFDDLVVSTADKHRVRGVRYTGEAANAHTTGDNYAAHALMVKDGLRR